MLASNVELSRRLDELESKYDKQFRVVFERDSTVHTAYSRRRELHIDKDITLNAAARS
jgi:hypothetical protein